MRLFRILETVTMHPWLITPGGYAAVTRLIDSQLGASENLLSVTDADAGNAVLNSSGSIAEVTISGVLGQRLSLLENIFGGCDYMDISGVVDQIAADPKIEGALFVFDSPGGMALGCPECADRIASLDKPKVGFSDSMMTSGAYYLASSLDYLVSTKSADVGSIGVIVPWIDQSRLWDRAGLEFAPIYSEGDTLKPTMYGPSLTAEQREYLQGRVNDVAKDFQTHVSAYRKLDFGELKAGSYSGQKALDFNLVDKIGGYKDAQNELARRVETKKAQRNSVARNRN